MRMSLSPHQPELQVTQEGRSGHRRHLGVRVDISEDNVGSRLSSVSHEKSP